MNKFNLEIVRENKRAMEILKEMALYEKENGFPNLEMINISSNEHHTSISRIYQSITNVDEYDSETEIVGRIKDNFFYSYENIIEGSDSKRHDEMLKENYSNGMVGIISRKTFAEILSCIK